MQFIDNASGNYFHETLAAAAEINCNALVAVLEEAAMQFPGGTVPADFNLRRNLWDEMIRSHTIKGEEYDIVEEKWEQRWGSSDRRLMDNESIFLQQIIEYLKKYAMLV